MESKLMLSVVVPIFNEELVIHKSFQEFRKALDTLDHRYEIVAVDDGSSDNTQDLLQQWVHMWPEVKLVTLVANRGHMAAITAGLENSSGDFVLTIDVDLQDPPEIIPKMLDMALTQNLHVVYGVRENRTKDTWFKRTTAHLYYKLLGRVLGIYVPMHAADCRLMSKTVVQVLNSLPEKQRVYRLLVPYLGFSFGEYKYARETRVAGKTHYSLKQMLNLTWVSITSFSTAPLRISTWAGFSGLILLLAGLIYVGFGWLQGNTSPGWASTVSVVLLMGSLQLITLGILGQYIAKIFVQVQDRPIYNLKTSNDIQSLDSHKSDE
jgi:glycosyltransferase involved in cell wall biosynthesis